MQPPPTTTYRVRARVDLIDKTHTTHTAREALAICKDSVFKRMWCEVTDDSTGERIAPAELIARAEQEAKDEELNSDPENR